MDRDPTTAAGRDEFVAVSCWRDHLERIFVAIDDFGCRALVAT
jgi:hypothetical protein